MTSTAKVEEKPAETKEPAKVGDNGAPASADKKRPLAHSRSRSRSRSPSHSRSRSRSGSSRSRSRSRSRSSRSRSYSRSRSRSRSPARGRSRSPRNRSPPPKKRSPTPEPKVLFVDKLTRNINKEHLLEIFGKYGKLKNVDLQWDRKANLSKGSAYVEFLERSEAENAQIRLDGAQIDGNVVKASFVLPRKPSPPRPPVGRRRTPPGGYRGRGGYAPFRGRGGYGRRSPPPFRRGPPPPRRRTPPPRRRRSYSRSRSRSPAKRPYSPTRSPSRSPPKRKRSASKSPLR